MNTHRTKIIAVALVLTLILGIGLAWGWDYINPGHKSKQEQAKAELLNQGIINVLLLGIDARPGETKARSDSMILVSIDTTNKKVGLISIPRDTRIKDGDHYQKINAFNFIGGPELAKQKVEELVGVPVHYYALTNFSGFKDIIDILGGVNIDVDKRMYKPSENIDLQPGLQKLDGQQALAYCRFRTDALGDITRIQRQQNFLKAVAAKMMQPSSLSKLPKLVPQINKCITTDIPMSKMLKIARAAEQFQQGQSKMVAQSLPGWFFNDPDSGASYWVVDDQKLPGIVDNVLNGTTIDFIEGTLDGQVASHPKGDQDKNNQEAPPSVKPDDSTNPTDNNNSEVTTHPGSTPDNSGDNTQGQLPENDQIDPQPENSVDNSNPDNQVNPS